MRKEDILTLIDQDIDEAFLVLDKVFHKTNATYNDFSRMYVDQSNDFSLGKYRGRLKRFVSLEYEDPSPTQMMPMDFTDSMYKALCDLDFKTQTDHFSKIYKYKKIAAFLLYGKKDPEGNDLRWLFKQLMNKEELWNDKHIIIDLGSKMGGSFERLLEEFYNRFDVYNLSSGNDPISVLRDEMQNRLIIGHLVCVIKNAENILTNQSELCKLYNELLSFMQKHIVRRGHEHSLIFLFIQDELPIELCRDAEYFFWFDKSKGDDYAFNAYTCQDLKIFDLTPIEKLKEADIVTWIREAMKYPAIFQKISCLSGQEKNILAQGQSPYQVIQNICSSLNITMDEKWIN